MRILALALITFIALFSGCAKSINRINPRDHGAQQIPTDSVSQTQYLLNHASVSCKDRAQCPGPVALLALGTQSFAGMCTAFLISPSLALTNSHCVPNEIREETELPENDMQLLFPETLSFSAQKVAVAQVVQWSEIAGEGAEVIGKKPDYALLRLSTPVNRGAFNLSAEGIPNNFLLTLYRVTPKSETAILGEVQVDHCESMMNSGAQPSYTDALISVFSFSGCETVHGNSGSPLLDSSGNVRAIVQAGYPESERKRIAIENNIQEVDALNMGTNLACAELPGVQSPSFAQCTKEIPQINLDAGMKQLADSLWNDPATQTKIANDIAGDFSQWQKSMKMDYPFHWGLKNTLNLDFYPGPDCLLKNKKIDSQYTFSSPVWSAQEVFDSRLRVRMEVLEETNPINFQYSISATTTIAYSSVLGSGGWFDVGYCN